MRRWMEREMKGVREGQSRIIDWWFPDMIRNTMQKNAFHHFLLQDSRADEQKPWFSSLIIAFA
jgi:hypothetical protein